MEAQQSIVGQLLTKFHELGTIRNIVAGGCGVFALEMSKALTILGIEHEITGMDSPIHSELYDVEEDKRKYLHIMVKVGSHYWDAEGSFKMRNLRVKRQFAPYGTFTLEELQEAVDNASMWNKSFDRNQIPELQQNMNISANFLAA